MRGLKNSGPPPGVKPRAARRRGEVWSFVDTRVRALSEAAEKVKSWARVPVEPASMTTARTEFGGRAGGPVKARKKKTPDRRIVTKRKSKGGELFSAGGTGEAARGGLVPLAGLTASGLRRRTDWDTSAGMVNSQRSVPPQEETASGKMKLYASHGRGDRDSQ